MTIQEIAARYCELARQMKWEEIIDTLYADEATCQEPEHAAQRGVPVLVQGKAAIKEKGTAHRAKIETLHGRTLEGPVVATTYFAVALNSDVTFKNGPRIQLSEIGVFHVQDGKITAEQFFYDFR